jgi:hypothetical protein
MPSLLSDGLEEQLREVIRYVRTMARNPDFDFQQIYPKSSGAKRREGILLDNVPGSTAPLTSPSFGTVRVLKKNSSGNLEVTDTCYEVAYRFTVPDLEAGSFCKIEFLDGEWSFYAVDCEDSGLPTTECA